MQLSPWVCINTSHGLRLVSSWKLQCTQQEFTLCHSPVVAEGREGTKDMQLPASVLPHCNIFQMICTLLKWIEGKHLPLGPSTCLPAPSALCVCLDRMCSFVNSLLANSHDSSAPIKV